MAGKQKNSKSEKWRENNYSKKWREKTQAKKWRENANLRESIFPRPVVNGKVVNGFTKVQIHAIIFCLPREKQFGQFHFNEAEIGKRNSSQSFTQ
jgi:hypothetical protein